MTSPGGGFHVGDAYVRVNAKVESRAIVAAVVGGLSAAQPAIMAASTGLFAGVGAAAVAQNDSIKRSWSRLGQDIREGARQDAAVLVPIYNNVAQKLGESFQRIRPLMREAFSDTAPQVLMLTDGVTSFAERAMPGLITSVDRAGPVMAGLRDMMGDLGSATGGFFEQISRNPDAGAETFRALGGVLQTILPTAGQLLSVFSEFTSGALPAFGEGLASGLGLLSGLLDVISPFAGILGTATGYVLTFVGAFKLFGLLTPVLAAVSARVVTLGIQAGIATMALTGSAAAGARVAGAFGSVANVLGRVGGALPIVGAALIGIGMIWDQVTSKADQFAQQVVSGSMSVQQAIQAEIAQVEANQIWWNSASQQQDAHAAARQRVIDKINAQLASMTPLQRAQTELQMAETAVGEAIRDHGVASDQARLAGENYRAKQVEVESQTRLVESVTKSWSDRLRELTDVISGVIGSNINYDGALLRVESATKAATEATRRHGAGSLEARTSVNSLEQAINAAAEAARQKAIADAGGEQAAGAAEAGTNAYRAELNRWTQAGGVAGETARKMTGRLNETQQQAIQTGGAIAGVTYQVRVLPDGKRVAIAVDHEGNEITDVHGRLDRLPKNTHIRVTSDGYWTMAGVTSHIRQGGKTLAEGGVLPGYTPGRDIHPAMLSGGEAVMRPEWTRAVGADWVHGANRAARTKGVRGVQEYMSAAAYAEGGIVPGTGEIVPRSYSSATRQSAAAVVAALKASGGGALGGGSGPGGVGWMMAALRAVFPALRLISGFRPGSITATGNRSYHASGRAVDIPPRMDVFNWIRANYGARTRELIFSPAGGRQVWNGRPHVYTGVTRAMHYDHVHWAYDKGGLARGPGVLPKGPEPERVLSPDQTRAFERALDNDFRNAGATNNFYVTIDARTVAEMQQVADFFSTVKQTARRGPGSVSGVRV